MDEAKVEADFKDFKNRTKKKSIHVWLSFMRKQRQLWLKKYLRRSKIVHVFFF